ncbi:unnamed protein product [Closterium sp. Naga37s-1]|nr:unnamed protein product [Closterium sp. Naga37s-1]
MQGIFDVRWLSRGDAVSRLVAVLPAAIVLLHEKDSTTYHLVTSLKFHFFLFFLADVLKELNELNKRFQRRSVQNTCEKLNARYVEYGVNFAEDSEHLTAFLEAHSHPSKRVVQVEGMDGDGNAVKHTFKLHELDAKKKEDPSGDVESCVSLATLFAKEVIGRLQYRMRSLKSFVGSKLFLPDAYPDGVNKRDRLCAEWFSSLRKMFNAEQCALPGTCFQIPRCP